MREHIYFVYMLASKEQGTLYTGVTNDVLRRAGEHREGLVAGFTRKYAVKRLVWFETHEDIRDAIVREKRIKRWRRDWKRTLIEEHNPHWLDLYPGLVQRLCRPAIDPALLAPLSSRTRSEAERSGTHRHASGMTTLLIMVAPQMFRVRSCVPVGPGSAQRIRAAWPG